MVEQLPKPFEQEHPAASLSHVTSSQSSSEAAKQPLSEELENGVHRLSTVHTSRHCSEKPWERCAAMCPAKGSLGVPCSPGLSPLTVAILLGWVGDQPTVVRSRGHQVRDAIIVIIIITLVTNPILVSVQLGAVNDSGAVVGAVLVPVSITVGERRGEALVSREQG